MRVRRHAACGTVLVADSCEVIVGPNDGRWPRNTNVRLPFCVKCKRIVDFEEVGHDDAPTRCDCGLDKSIAFYGEHHTGGSDHAEFCALIINNEGE